MLVIPKVSIIIPTYNRSTMVTKAVHSALSQSYNWKEVIVVDDASTDDTKKNLENIYGDQIRLLIQPKNLGAPAARNRGFKEASGEYIQFLDSDDTLASDKIERQMNWLKDHPEAVVYGPWLRVSYDEVERQQMDTEVLQELPENADRLAFMLNGWFAPQHCYLYPKNILEQLGELGPWDETLAQNQDIDLAYRIHFLGTEIFYCPHGISYYHIHRNNKISGKIDDVNIQSRVSVLNKVYTALCNSNKIELYKRQLATSYFRIARDAARWNIRKGIEIEKIAIALDKNFPVLGKRSYQMIYRVFGFRVAEFAAKIKVSFTG